MNIFKHIIFFLLLYSITYSNAYDQSSIKVSINNDTIKTIIQLPKNYHQILQKDYLYSTADSSKIVLSKPIYLNGESIKNNVEFKDSVIIKRAIIRNNLETSDSVTITVGYQICSENGTCLFPIEKKAKILILADKKPTSGDFSILLKFLAFAFLGGIILNIMPCVLPVLSIKAMSLVKQSGESKKSILKQSFAYTFGVVLSFWVLAIAVIILKISGEAVGWGFQFQSPTFVFFLLIIIFIFALSMFDIIIFHSPVSSTGGLDQKKGVMGAIFSGVFAVLLATPCTAPMLGPAIGFAFSQPSYFIFLIFTLIGLGLAFPFLLLGFFPSLIQKIPKPGEWMNIFKFVMGFLLLATVLFLYRSLYFLIGGDNSISVLWFLLILSFFIWIFGKYYNPMVSKKKKLVIFIISLILTIISGKALISFEDNSINSSESKYSGWLKFDEKKVLSDIASGKKVFIDFTAEWCMTCQTNKITVLHTADMMNYFKKHNIILYYADNTKKNIILDKWLKKYERAGVPLYLYFDERYPKGIIFPEILTPDMLKSKMNIIEKKTSNWKL